MLALDIPGGEPASAPASLAEAPLEGSETTEVTDEVPVEEPAANGENVVEDEKGNLFAYLQVTEGTEGQDYVFEDNVLKVKDGATLTVSVSSPSGQVITQHIEVEPGTANLTLDNVEIDLSVMDEMYGVGPVVLQPGADLNLRLVGHNILKCGSSASALWVPLDAAVTISAADSQGTLYATSGEGGAAIGAAGGNPENNGGKITIHSGTIIATADVGGCGIGSGNTWGKGATVEITGGTVTATGGAGGAGISGQVTISGGIVRATGRMDSAGIGDMGLMAGAGGSVTISGGDVTAIGGSYNPGIGGHACTVKITGGTVWAVGGSRGAGIGSGRDDDGCPIEISGGSVTAIGGDGAPGIGKTGTGNALGTLSSGANGTAWIDASSVNLDTSAFTSGVLFDGNDGALYGRRFLLEDKVSVPQGKTLRLSGNTLEIGPNGILNGPGTVAGHGAIVNRGVLRAKISSSDVNVKGPVTGVTIDQKELTLTVGETAVLTATLEPAAAMDIEVLWSSSNEAVAAVDRNGKVTAVGKGWAVVTAETAEAGYRDFCAVTVELAEEPDTAIALDRSSLTLHPGETAQLKATVSPGDATSKEVNWETSDSAVAVVKDGMITAKAEGTATITAKSQHGHAAKCVVTVKKAWPTTGIGGFATRCYDAVLGREPDADGHNTWVRVLSDGSWTAERVAWGFVFSEEYLHKNTTNDQYVRMLYRLYMDREPDADGYNTWMGMLRRQEMSREQVMEGFSRSKEFRNICARYGMTPW